MMRIKKMLTMLLTICILCIPASACNVITNNCESSYPNLTPVYEDGIEGQSILVNEYDLYKFNASSKSSIAKELQNDAYIHSLKELTKYSYEDLQKMNYSEGNIALIEKFRNDPTYVPSESELTRAGATVRCTFACSDSYMQNGKTYFDFIWSFRWTSAPVQKHKDAFGVHWHGDFYMDEVLVDAEVNYTGISSSGTPLSSTVDYGRTMRLGILPNKNACSLEFPLEKALGDTLIAESGSGSFRLSCNDHLHPDVTIEWGYGHSMISVTSVNFNVGTDIPSITFGEDTDIVASGNRTYYVN